jgi:DNA replication protein DnaC
LSHESFERLQEILLKLKVNTADDILDSVLEHSANQQLATGDVLDRLIDAELKARRPSAIDTNSKLALRPVHQRIEDFDLAFQPSIDKAVFDDLRTLRFVSEAKNLILPGPLEVWKNHISIGRFWRRIKAGYSPYYISTPFLVERRRNAEQEGKMVRTNE